MYLTRMWTIRRRLRSSPTLRDLYVDEHVSESELTKVVTKLLQLLKKDQVVAWEQRVASNDPAKKGFFVKEDRRHAEILNALRDVERYCSSVQAWKAAAEDIEKLKHILDRAPKWLNHHDPHVLSGHVHWDPTRKPAGQ